MRLPIGTAISTAVHTAALGWWAATAISGRAGSRTERADPSLAHPKPVAISAAPLEVVILDAAATAEVTASTQPAAPS
ncbi:MAG: hypothetical protein H0X17_10885, partial [Deltaproteobacteria bacterium]|nr:hypothetical protein [Deltaproteobacteria bacterium]